MAGQPTCALQLTALWRPRGHANQVQADTSAPSISQIDLMKLRSTAATILEGSGQPRSEPYLHSTTVYVLICRRCGCPAPFTDHPQAEVVGGFLPHTISQVLRGHESRQLHQLHIQAPRDEVG